MILPVSYTPIVIFSSSLLISVKFLAAFNSALDCAILLFILLPIPVASSPVASFFSVTSITKVFPSLGRFLVSTTVVVPSNVPPVEDLVTVSCPVFTNFLVPSPIVFEKKSFAVTSM